MKATGIIRRIDELGRIVIPKEIRRTLGLREGDPMEVYLEDDGIMFKRYEYLETVEELLERAIRTVREMADDTSVSRSTSNRIVSLLEDAIAVAEEAKR